MPTWPGNKAHREQIMDGLLVFDEQNDIVFTKFNDAIKRKLISIAKLQELMENDAVCLISTNLVPLNGHNNQIILISCTRTRTNQLIRQYWCNCSAQ